MEMLSLRRSIMNIQKCLIPDSEFLQKNYGRYCLVTPYTNCSGIIVKIGLNEPKHLTSVFVDSSVVLLGSEVKAPTTSITHDIKFHNFKLLPPLANAQKVNLTVVFCNAIYLRDLKNESKIKEILKEILKLYVFTYNCVIFLHNLPTLIANSIYCIEINGINDTRAPQVCEIFSITEETELCISEYVSKKKFEVGFNREKQIQLGGLNTAYHLLKQLIDFSKESRKLPPNIASGKNILLFGPPGCGKTTLVRNLIQDSKSVLIEVLLPEVCSPVLGEVEENLQKIFDEAKIHAENNENCVILIEDIDMICVKKRNVWSNLRGVVTKLISLLEEFDTVNGVIVIATSNNPDDIDSQLRKPKRFDNELEILFPTQDERKEIISKTFDYFSFTCSEEILLDFAVWTPGFVGADILYTVQECILLYSKLEKDLSQIDYTLLTDCFKKVVSSRIPTSLKVSADFNKNKDVCFSEIGGLHDVIKSLNMYVTQQLLNPETFRRLGIPLTKGILLYGPPGCAKTTLVKALAKESNTTFLSVSSADLYSPYVGDPEKKIMQLFSQARTAAPAIIFIDEIDALIGSKSSERIRGVQERVLSTLLVEMDGIGLKVGTQRNTVSNLFSNSIHGEAMSMRGSGIIVIGATNRPEQIDSALMRPGRFDKIVYVPPPDEKGRLEILRKLTKNMPLGDDVDLELIAKNTYNYSGADLKHLCHESVLLALTNSNMKANFVNQCHFRQVLSISRSSLNTDNINFYESFQRNIT